MVITNEYIENWIVNRMAQPEYNNMKELPGFAFDQPLVGFSRGDDPLYPFYKEHIDRDFYRLPNEWLESTFGGSFDPANISVISWVLPQTAENKALSRQETDCPTLEWQMVRVHGEQCNRDLADALVAHLKELGIPAVAPMTSDQFSWGDSEKFVKVSN